MLDAIRTINAIMNTGEEKTIEGTIEFMMIGNMTAECGQYNSEAQLIGKEKEVKGITKVMVIEEEEIIGEGIAKGENNIKMKETSSRGFNMSRKRRNIKNPIHLQIQKNRHKNQKFLCFLTLLN